MSKMRRSVKPKGRRGPRLLWAVLGTLSVSVLAAGVVVWLGHAAPAGDATVPTSTSPHDLGEKRPIDWDRPIGGIYVATNDEAAAHISFAPLVPRGLGDPVKIMVNDPAADHAGTTVAWVYQHPTHGRFFVIEGFTSFTQTSLVALATCDPAKGCEGKRALLQLKNGATGVLITGGPTTGILWLWHGLTFDVYGPIDTFSVASARTVADSI